MKTTAKYPINPILNLGKKKDDVDKGTSRDTPGNNQGARPPQEEDFDKIHDKNQKDKRKN